MALPIDPKRRPGSVRRTAAAMPAVPPPPRPSARTVAPAARQVQLTPAQPERAVPAAGGTGGTAVRRKPRPVRRSSSGGGLDVPPIFIRLGIVGVIVVIGAVANVASGKSSGDRAYWRAATEFDKRLDKNPAGGAQELRRQINALPISGVTDPKLKEFHNLMLEILDLAARAETDTNAIGQLLSKQARFEKLVDELNLKYAGHK
jgi:hypothetical protein